MHFQPGEVYHVYNRGNDKQAVFFNANNYLFLLRKIRQEWLPYCDILVYCLMPNHFHFLLAPNAKGCESITLKDKETHLQYLSKAIGKTLASYTQAINREQNRTGNLFQKKTKAKWLDAVGNSFNYMSVCCKYIHANPVMANLAKEETGWDYSSAKDYLGLRNGTLCNKELFLKLSGMSLLDFNTSETLSEELIRNFY